MIKMQTENKKHHVREIVAIVGIMLLLWIGLWLVWKNHLVVKQGWEDKIPTIFSEKTGIINSREKSENTQNPKKEELSEREKIKKTCPDGICEMQQATTEEECDSTAGVRDDRTEKCIDVVKQEIIKEPSLEEKKCKEQWGVYERNGEWVESCVITESDQGEKCSSVKDCKTGLCEVQDFDDKKWICNADPYFKWCKKFISPNGKVVRVCK